MGKALVFCGMMALLASVPAHAEWFKVSTSVNNSTWYMDPERVRVVDNKVQAWVRIDSSHDHSVKWSEAKELISIDCSAEKYRTLSTVTYDSYGKIISTNSVPDYGYGIGYDPIVPDSMVEAVERLACLAAPQGQ